jgi:hypothetical protein
MKCTHRSALIPVLVTVVALAAAAAILMPPQAAAAEPTGMWLGASSPTRTGGDISVAGGLKIRTALPGATVAIYKREVGETTDTLVAEVPLSLAFWGNTFRATVPDVTRTCVLTATWAGNADYLPTSYWLVAPVRAKVTIAAPRVSAAMTRLVSRVTPAQPMDAPAFVAIDVPIMVFQRRIDGHWRRFFGAGVWGTDGENWYSAKYFHLRPGTYVVRARFVGSNYNAAAVSRAIRFTIE